MSERRSHVLKSACPELRSAEGLFPTAAGAVARNLGPLRDVPAGLLSILATRALLSGVCPSEGISRPASLYTDLRPDEVGTSDAYGEWFGPLIDTPTLRYLYDSAPYLHDGGAATLRDVLTTANPNDEHGVTSHLTEQEIADLIAFVSALPHNE